KPGRLELEKSVLDVLENIGTLKINVLRVGGSDGQIRTWCKTVPKSARPGSDFMPVSKELVFEEGEVRKIIEVEILDNHHKEPVRKFEVLLFEPSAGPEVNSFTGLGNKKATLVNILDNDMTPGSLQLEKSRYEVKESDEKIVIPVIRMGGNDGQIRVKLQTTPITATANKDFPLLDQELIFREGETKKVIRIPIFDNTIRELDRTFEIHLTDSTAGSGVLNFEGLGPITRAVVTIKDDDMTPGYLQFDKDSYAVVENSKAVDVDVVRMEGNDGEIRATYSTDSKTAVAGSDFKPISGDLIFLDGETRKTIRIPIMDDNIREPTKTFEVKLMDSSPGEGVINFRGLGPRRTTIVSITDDDMTPGFFELDRFSYEVFENEGGVQIVVVRNAGSDGVAQVNYTTLAETAIPYKDFVPASGTLVFKEGETRKIIHIPILDDEIREPTKTFQVQLKDPSAEPGVMNFGGLGSQFTATVRIKDDDMTPGVLEMEKPSYVVREGDRVIQIDVIREGGSQGEIRVDYLTVPKTASARTDFNPTSGELIFKEGETRKNIFVPIIDDRIKEPTETFEVQLKNPTPGQGVINFKGAGKKSTAIVSITDDDMTPGFFELERPSYVVREDSQTVSINVVRVHGSDGVMRVRTKTVPKTALALRDFMPRDEELIFKDGEIRKTIHIPIIDDKIREPTKSFDVRLIDATSEIGGRSFKGIGSRFTTTVTINDDDMVPGLLEFEDPTYIVREDKGLLEAVVVRKHGTDGRIRTMWTTKPKTALAGIDYSPVTSELVFNEGDTKKSIFVPIRDDSVKEPTKSFEIQLFQSSAGPEVLNFKGLGKQQTTEVFIQDDDMQPGFLEFENAPMDVSESTGTVSVTVLRVDGSDGEIRAKYKTLSRSAKSGKDFTPIQGELIFKDGETRKKITVKIANDNIREPLENFEIHLLETTIGDGDVNFRGLGERNTMVINIHDDDSKTILIF
ncbi:adhesion G-protein coupled receptor V1, partial [Trichonephila clavata]